MKGIWLMSRQKIFFGFIFLGFILGILYMNLIAIDYLSVTGIFNQYYLEDFLETNIGAYEYLPRILWIRIGPLTGIIFLARSRINRLGVIIFLIWTGFLYGLYMTLGIAQLGINGILFCVVGLLPQMICYIPAYLIALIFSYQYPNSQCGIEKIVVIILCILCGIILECQVNPILIKWFINVL